MAHDLKALQRDLANIRLLRQRRATFTLGDYRTLRADILSDLRFWRRKEAK